MPAALPEVGNTVHVRGRPYLVESISPQAMSSAGSSMQHMVGLSCIDENSLNEHLSAIWEIEPGAEVLSQSSMPLMERFDESADLDAFIHAVHWGVVSQMDQSTMTDII